MGGGGGYFDDTPACSQIRAKGKAVMYKYARTVVSATLRERTRDVGLDSKEAGSKEARERRGPVRATTAVSILTRGSRVKFPTFGLTTRGNP